MNIIHFEMNSKDRELFESMDSNENQTNSVHFFEEALDIDVAQKASEAEIVSVFVNSTVDAKVIDTLPNLKLLVTRSTGFDHIDVAYANSKGIQVCNIPSYGSRTVAEFTFALLLALSRKIVLAVEQIKNNNSWDTSHFEGFSLQGKTLGVVGTGKIGLNVIQIAKGFDMNVIAHDAFPNEQKAKDYGFSYTSLNELLNQSDVVTFHVPSNSETHHLINKENISQLKKGTVLVNTSRGDVIDPEAILEGLKSGVIAGAALDVLEGEHDLKEEAELMAENKLNYEHLKVLLNDHVLMDHPNVIITPHNAFNTTEARKEIMKITLENIGGYINNNSLNIITIPHE